MSRPDTILDTSRPDVPHVMFVVPWIDVGGADRAIVDLVRCVDHGRMRPVVVTTQDSPNRHLRECGSVAEICDLAAFVPHHQRAGALIDLARSCRIVAALVMNSRVGFDVLPELVALTPRPRIVAQMHAEEAGGGGYPRYVAERFADLVDVFAPSTAALATRLQELGVSADRIRTVPTGIDERRYVAAPVADSDGVLRVMFPARLAAEKDPLLFVDVIGALHDSGHDVRATMYDGPMRDEVAARVASRGLAEVVTVAGAVPDLADEYRRHDVAVLTSLSEGAPLALLEAMASALPVVAPDVGGIPEIVDHQVGIVVRERSVEAFTAAILAAVADAPRLGAAGRDRVAALHSCRRGAATFTELLLAAAA